MNLPYDPQGHRDERTAISARKLEVMQAQAEIQMHYCESPGLTMADDLKWEHLPNHGKPCWKVTQQIESIFGSEVDGQCSGIGRTRKEALNRLQENQAKLYESLWA